MKNILHWKYYAWSIKSRRYISTAALYVHWPYCKRRCTYCNFNKYIDASVNDKRMQACLLQEADTLMNLAGIKEVTSIFFGGGTPSLAKPETFESLINAVNSKAYLSPDSEISMEVNPTALEQGKLRQFKESGINRVSIGIQTLDEKGLQILGRDHTAKESLRCLETASSLFPRHVSVDLIFGWPGQTLDMWLSELNKILTLCDNHVSLYQLTLERGTKLFKDIEAGHLKPVDLEVMEEMYLQAVQILGQNNFERYEVSNFATQNSYSFHNLAYWTGQQYIGIGPGAHGRFQPIKKGQREARIQTLEPNDWMWEVENYGHATRKVVPLNSLQQLEELLIVGLRTKWGISKQAWSKIFPEKSMVDILCISEEVQSLVYRGLLKFDNSGLHASPEGINIIDSILPDLLVALGQGYKSLSNTVENNIT